MYENQALALACLYLEKQGYERYSQVSNPKVYSESEEFLYIKIITRLKNSKEKYYFVHVKVSKRTKECSFVRNEFGI